MSALLTTYAGAIFYRMRGGAPKWPQPTEQMLFCVIYLFALLMSTPWPLALAGYALSVAGCCTGHGQYFLALKVKAIKPERLDFIVRFFYGRDPRTTVVAPENDPLILVLMKDYDLERLYMRCLFGLAVTGLAVTLAPGIILSLHAPVPGVMLALSGVLKAPAYHISQKLTKSTELAEYLTGAVLWLYAYTVVVA